jgi:type I restriction enzyme S subunit
MSDVWEQKTVIELQREGHILVEDGNHGAYRPRPDEFGVGEWAFVRAADMDNGRILFESAERINHTARERITKGVGAGGDVILSHKGTVGKLALTPLDSPLYVCSPQTTFWRCLNPNRLDRCYLYYFMLSDDFQEQLNARKGETDMAPYVSLTAQRELKVTIPPIDIQRAIARTLSALDDKIELNRRMNHTLESMAQALFKSWFVDFEFKDETPEFVETGDDDFPLIPKGWSLSSLSAIANYENGLPLQKFRPEGTEFLPVIKIRELRQGYADDSSEQASPNIKPSCILDDGDMVFSWSGSLMIDLWCGGKGALNQHLFKVTSEKFPKWFYYFWTRYHLSDFQNIAEGKATTMGHIQRHHLDSAKVIVPSDEVLQKADKLIRPLMDLVVKNRVQSRTLASIRDALLPRLLSGEVRVGNGLPSAERTNG